MARLRRFADRGGFTLVEVLVAFTVMAMLLSVLFRGVVAIRAGSVAFGERSQLELAALDELEHALSDRYIRTGTFSGQHEGRRWTLIAEPIDLVGQLPQSTEVPTPDRQAQPGPPSRITPGGTVAATNPPTEPGVTERPVWTTQRLRVRVSGGGRPIEFETIHLVRAK